jgi:hypothetical protein
MRKTSVARLLARRPDGIFIAPYEAGEIGPDLFRAACRIDKAMTVAKLRGARERKRRKTGGKVEGRKSYVEANPQLVELARDLSEQRPRLSLREISAALASKGFTTPRGLPYSASAVASIWGLGSA